MKNNFKFKIILLATYIASSTWIICGLITLGSIYLSRIGFTINFIVGLLFILLGVYIYSKEKALLELLVKAHEGKQSRLIKKVIIGEIIFITLALLVGIVIVSAVSSRVFGEGFAVFG